MDRKFDTSVALLPKHGVRKTHALNASGGTGTGVVMRQSE